MGKAALNKQQKREALLNTAFNLFTTKGLHNTSISDIVEQAGVAKGTFYLYFKDKYDINNKLMMYRSAQLFDAAMEKLATQNFDNFNDKVIFMVNDIVDSLTENKLLLMFISKNLGLGFFKNVLDGSMMTEYPAFSQAYDDIIKETEGHIDNPRLMMYMIVELTGSCIYSSILHSDPVPIEELKPHLFKTINGIINQFSSES